jgi:chromosome segregation ATPase
MRGQLKNSKAGKELAVQEVEECRETIRALKRQVYDRDDQIEEQREQYEGKLKAVEAKNAELEREIKRLRKRKAADVED